MTLLVFGLLLLAPGCGATNAGLPFLTTDAMTRGTTLTVSGNTDLPDGSVIHLLGFYSGVDPLHLAMVSGLPSTTTVVSGSYQATADTSTWSLGKVITTALFYVDATQPPAVLERFGPNGERLDGPQVREDTDGVRILDASTEVTIP